MYYGTNKTVCQFDACSGEGLVGCFDLFKFIFMLFDSEIQAPGNWEIVHIQTGAAPRDEVAELIAQIQDTGLKVKMEPGYIVVTKEGDSLAVRAFEDGVVPDLRTRGFGTTWLPSGGI